MHDGSKTVNSSITEREHFEPNSDAPQWFLDNISQPGESVYTEVSGRSVHLLTWNWNNPQLPTLLLVHGYGAHAHWWSYLAPFFTEHHRVAVLDLPAMGDSEAPPVYDDTCFASAIIAVIEAHDLAPVTIVGHSFGGAQSIRAMGMAPQLFRHGIIVDTNVRLPPEPLIRKLQPKGAHKTSPTRNDCASRFRLLPPHPDYIDTLVQYIGFHSCTQGESGWHWKADPSCRNVGEIEDPAILQAASTRIDMIFGEKSFLNVDNKPQRVMHHFPNPGTLLTVPDAGHHMMVDHPLELVSAIKSLL